MPVAGFVSMIMSWFHALNKPESFPTLYLIHLKMLFQKLAVLHDQNKWKDRSSAMWEIIFLVFHKKMELCCGGRPNKYGDPAIFCNKTLKTLCIICIFKLYTCIKYYTKTYASLTKNKKISIYVTINKKISNYLTFQLSIINLLISI